MSVLRLVYPEEQSFHVGMAKDSGHLEKLGAVLEERLGSNPRLEIRAAGGEASATTAAEEQPPPAAPMEQPAPGRYPKRTRRRQGVRTDLAVRSLRKRFRVRERWARRYDPRPA